MIAVFGRCPPTGRDIHPDTRAAGADAKDSEMRITLPDRARWRTQHIHPVPREELTHVRFQGATHVVIGREVSHGEQPNAPAVDHSNPDTSRRPVSTRSPECSGHRSMGSGP